MMESLSSNYEPSKFVNYWWLPVPAICENWTSSFLFINKPKNEKDLQNEDEAAFHPIHLALEFQKLLDEELVNSRSEIAKRYGMSRARVIQVMHLLALPVGIQEYLLSLDSKKAVRRFSERRLRPIFRIESPRGMVKARIADKRL